MHDLLKLKRITSALHLRRSELDFIQYVLDLIVGMGSTIHPGTDWDNYTVQLSMTITVMMTALNTPTLSH